MGGMGKGLECQGKEADFLCRALDKLLIGRGNFGTLVGSSEDDDGLEREEPLGARWTVWGLCSLGR